MSAAVIVFLLAFAFSGTSAQPTGFNGLQISEPETVEGSTVVVGDIECVGADPSSVVLSIEDADAVPFALHPPAGAALVKLNRTVALDYESGPRFYQFNITCSDSLGSVSGTVQVTVTSVNEYPPDIEIDPPSVRLPETSPAGTVILSQGEDGLAKIIATDMDEGEDGVLTFTDPEPLDFSHFSINRMDGTVTLTTPFDVDAGDDTSVFISVRACDQETLPSACPISSLTLFIIPVNEFDPQFTQANYTTTNASYSEGDYSNEVIATAECSDSDIGIGAFKDIELYNLPGELSSVVGIMVNQVTGTAQVVLNGSLDYDTIRLTQLQIELRCYDSGDPARDDIATVTLNIQDIDDNLPVFSSDTYTASVVETLSVGEEVLTLQCSDGDYGAGALVGMELISEDTVNSTFSLNSSSEVLSLRQALDYDTDPQQYQLMVRCYDSSGNEAFAAVNVSVSGVNDEPVYFTQSLYQFTINRLEPPNDVVVGTVKTRDGDRGEQTTTYSIEDNPNFGIDNEGNILLQDFILHVEGDLFNLTVFASDGENPDAEAVVEVTVEGPLSLLDIILIVAGAVLLILIITVLFCCCALIRRRLGRKKQPTEATALGDVWTSDGTELLKTSSEENIPQPSSPELAILVSQEVRPAAVQEAEEEELIVQESGEDGPGEEKENTLRGSQKEDEGTSGEGETQGQEEEKGQKEGHMVGESDGKAGEGEGEQKRKQSGSETEVDVVTTVI